MKFNWRRLIVAFAAIWDICFGVLMMGGEIEPRLIIKTGRHLRVLAISKNGEIACVAAGTTEQSSNGPVEVYDSANGTLLASYGTADESIYHAAFLGDHELVVEFRRPTRIAFFDRLSGRERASIGGKARRVTGGDVKISPDGKSIAHWETDAAGRRQLVIVDVKSLEVIGRLPAGWREFDFRAEDSAIVTSLPLVKEFDRSLGVQIFSKGGELMQEIALSNEGGNPVVRKLELSRDGRWLLIKCDDWSRRQGAGRSERDNQLIVVDAASGKRAATISELGVSAFRLRDLKCFAIAREDGSIFLDALNEESESTAVLFERAQERKNWLRTMEPVPSRIRSFRDRTCLCWQGEWASFWDQRVIRALAYVGIELPSAVRESLEVAIFDVETEELQCATLQRGNSSFSEFAPDGRFLVVPSHEGDPPQLRIYDLPFRRYPVRNLWRSLAYAIAATGLLFGIVA